MTTAFLEPVLPWSGPQPEDLRFRRILGSVLSLFLLIGLIMPRLPLPVVEPESPPDLPGRIAYIIADPVAIAPPAGAVTELPEATAAPGVPTREDEAPQVPTQAPARAPEATAKTVPRKQVAETGLLALSDALEQMRGTTPNIADVNPQLSRDEGQGDAAARVTGALSIGVTRGSGGIGNAAPTHQQVLGSGGLDVSGITPGSSVPAGGLSTGRAGDGRGSRRGRFRTEEEIQEILNRHKRAIYTIYNRELLADPTLQGKVVVSISIAPSGKVTNCRIVYSELGTAAFEGKLVSLIRGIDFGAIAGVPPVTTKVPIEFFPT